MDVIETIAMDVFVDVDVDMIEGGYEANRIDHLLEVLGRERNFEEPVDHGVVSCLCEWE